eukprot:CAMPEP_0181256828 /NCGR_PEP_ID=MMETSP1096-20121128/49917_1 /TAXON_ID=156174 ORGANISM="Chrysochromulina ericina, Strain CCMP281" /NCGR_SAMPLE_ID=MMETSP1096 /ASSEMBLY_ACC=CAM_ASM_000453 /LENGTH=218 /DNA_ID=CAMNT_0023355101 /DNA_START=598 /DNA_END=1251 /DNA_ORIENTATION=-
MAWSQLQKQSVQPCSRATIPVAITLIAVAITSAQLVRTNRAVVAAEKRAAAAEVAKNRAEEAEAAAKNRAAAEAQAAERRWWRWIKGNEVCSDEASRLAQATALFHKRGVLETSTLHGPRCVGDCTAVCISGQPRSLFEPSSHLTTARALRSFSVRVDVAFALAESSTRDPERECDAFAHFPVVAMLRHSGANAAWGGTAACHSFFRGQMAAHKQWYQ